MRPPVAGFADGFLAKDKLPVSPSVHAVAVTIGLDVVAGALGADGKELRVSGAYPEGRVPAAAGTAGAPRFICSSG